LSRFALATRLDDQTRPRARNSPDPITARRWYFTKSGNLKKRSGSTRKRGRPLALYTDRDSVFQWQSRGRAQEGLTQFGRALATLEIELILAHSPQAKGRIECFFGVAQDRWVKEMRLAGVTTLDQANALVRRQLMPDYNRRFTRKPAEGSDAHRDLGPAYCLAAILCLHHQRVVMNDYTVRWSNRLFQLAPPALPGLRGGQVTLEERRDGTLKIRFVDQYVKFHEIVPGSNQRAVKEAAAGAGRLPQLQSGYALLPLRQPPPPRRNLIVLPQIIRGEGAFGRKGTRTFLLWRICGHFYCAGTGGANLLAKRLSFWHAQGSEILETHRHPA
jgi:hypothetical protein